MRVVAWMLVSECFWSGSDSRAHVVGANSNGGNGNEIPHNVDSSRPEVRRESQEGQRMGTAPREINPGRSVCEEGAAVHRLFFRSKQVAEQKRQQRQDGLCDHQVESETHGIAELIGG